MGAETTLGGNEICLWGSAFTPVDQSFCRISNQATSTQSKERRTRVFCLSLIMLELARILYNIYLGPEKAVYI